MGRQQIIESVTANQLKPSQDIPYFSVGDTLNVHVRIIEGDKERIQVYQGVLIAEKGRGINKTIMVRRIVANEGVERVFPLHSPRISKIEVVRRGDVRRAKLYYLRDRIGKSRRLREQRRGLKFAEAAGSTLGMTGGTSGGELGDSILDTTQQGGGKQPAQVEKVEAESGQ